MFGEDRPLTGLRVRVKNGLTYPEFPEDCGLARVRYGSGHQNEGKYEVETADGSSQLFPAWLLEPISADQIPNGIIFPDVRKAYHATFCKPGVKQSGADVTGANVIFPGDTGLLQPLIESVKPSWRVEYVSRNANEFCGSRTVVANSGRTLEFASLKWKGWNLSNYFGWPGLGDDFTVHGNRLCLYTPYSSYSGGRSVRLSLTFCPK